jgi:hypothetical protein
MPVAPKPVREAAKKALEARENVAPSRRAGTRVGLARANQLANGDNVSYSTLRRMRSYLIRAKENYEQARDAGLDLESSKAIQAYYLWGGPRALTWVNSELAKNE